MHIFLEWFLFEVTRKINSHFIYYTQIYRIEYLYQLLLIKFVFLKEISKIDSRSIKKERRIISCFLLYARAFQMGSFFILLKHD